MCRGRKNRRKNALLVLTTPGGLADSAYRIGRALQRAYCTREGDSSVRGRLIIYVHSFCKSGGTLLALGADQLIMSQLAELGPIDVQLRKEEEVGDWTSGLTAVEALATLRQQAMELFLKQFRSMRFGRETRFSTRMSAEVATKLTTGLLEPIYGQIDPMRLGEIERFVRISFEYGDRLATSNVNDETLAQLVVGYPSHGFVIDRREARRLFKTVDRPTDDLELLGELALREADKNSVFEQEAHAIMRFENEEKPDARQTSSASNSRASRRASRGRKAPIKRAGSPSDQAPHQARSSSTGIGKGASRGKNSQPNR